ncbi:MAG TPA: tetratricopeptide repeat protein, partial [Flavisolibacter sp.]|nr:tetratricopeptide repeat protein [Flavisolibacter sp.]
VLSAPPYDKLTDSISDFPKNPGLYYKRGRLLFANGQPERAEKDLRKAWTLQPREEYGLSLTTVLKQKSVDTAVLFLQHEALKKLPESIAFRIALARGFQQKKLWNEAMEVCKEITDRYPAQLDALMLQAELLKEQDKDAEALTILEKAYGYAPGDPEVAHALAFDYAEAKNPKALRLADSLIRADAGQRHAEPYYFKGVYFENIGNKQEAIRFFDEATRHDYYFLDAYMDKGSVLYDSKNFADALKTFQLAATITPTYAEAYYWIGKTQEAMGNKGEAKLNYQRAFGLDKEMTEAKEAADRLK